MENLDNCAVSFPGMFTFYYTNYAFSENTYNALRQHFKSRLGVDSVDLFISNSWNFKNTLGSPGVVDKIFEFSDVTDWSSSIFLNFRYEELTPYLNKIKHVASNFIDKDNIRLLMSADLDVILLPRADFSVRGAIVPFHLSFDEEQRVQVFQPASQVDKKFITTAGTFIRDFDLAKVKSAMMKFTSTDECRMTFIMEGGLVDEIFALIEQEEEFVRILFNIKSVIYLPCRVMLHLPIERDKIIELEDYRLRNQNSKKWTSYPHQPLNRASMQERGVFISVVEMGKVCVSFNKIESTYKFLIL